MTRASKQPSPIDFAAVTCRIITVRQAKGLSQDDVARLVGITRGGLAHIERGRTGSMPVTTFVRLANALGVHPGWLLDGVQRRAVTP